MQTVPEAMAMLALFDMGGSQIILILALVLIFFGARKIPEMTRGLGRGIREFRDAVDEEAKDAGKSIGGIYGKEAAQALTPDNKVAEFYDAAVFEEKPRPGTRRRGLLKSFVRMWLWVKMRVGKWLR